jgi:hypothetical protein
LPEKHLSTFIEEIKKEYVKILDENKITIEIKTKDF